MFPALYNIVLRVAQRLLPVATPFNAKIRTWTEGRVDWADRLKNQLAGNTNPVVWFHAASLGEFEQGRPVIEAFRTEYPTHKILLTFFSPSGYDVRKNYEGADYITYLPADTPANARQFITLVKPQIAFFIKYEFWYNYLHELKAAQVPVILFSAIFRPSQLFFKPYGPVSTFYRSMLSTFDCILVQNQESVDLLRGIGMNRVILAGDTRFDRVSQTAAARKDISIAQIFKAGQPLLVVGSAWPEDMAVLILFLNAFEEPLKAIIAPHEIHEEEIKYWRKQLIKPSTRFSQTNETDVSQADILFIDNVGMLSSLYQYGEFAFIGGAFKQGLHNILEAATFGMPLFFGPDYDKFQEAIDLVNEGAAFPVGTVTELSTAFVEHYADPGKAAQISRDYVLRNIGATAKVMEVVKNFAHWNKTA